MNDSNILSDPFWFEYFKRIQAKDSNAYFHTINSIDVEVIEDIYRYLNKLSQDVWWFGQGQNKAPAVIEKEWRDSLIGEQRHLAEKSLERLQGLKAKRALFEPFASTYENGIDFNFIADYPNIKKLPVYHRYKLNRDLVNIKEVDFDLDYNGHVSCLICKYLPNLEHISINTDDFRENMFDDINPHSLQKLKSLSLFSNECNWEHNFNFSWLDKFTYLKALDISLSNTYITNLNANYLGIHYNLEELTISVSLKKYNLKSDFLLKFQILRKLVIRNLELEYDIEVLLTKMSSLNELHLILCDKNILPNIQVSNLNKLVVSNKIDYSSFAIANPNCEIQIIDTKDISFIC